MGRTCGLLAHGAQLGALSGTDARPAIERASAMEKAVSRERPGLDRAAALRPPSPAQANDAAKHHRSRPRRGSRRLAAGREPSRRRGMRPKLIIGNKNYSSWSLRPWIAMKVAGISFDEEVISLNAQDFKARVTKISGTGKVPALADGDAQVWESLAILEYLAEKHPDARLSPADPAPRALARAIAAEMHAGFIPLRRPLPMNMWRPVIPRPLTAEVESNVRRIEAMWTQCRKRYGAGGAFLFGSFGAADAMYAPVVSRFHTYAVHVPAVAPTYTDSL